MISKSAQKLAYFFVKKNVIQSEDEEIYAYGYEIMISETINWLITIIIAALTRSIAETVFYMLAFIRLRGAIGGFHAKSHIGCIVISTVVYVLCLFIVHYTPMYIYRVLMIIGLLIHLGSVLAIAPVAHPNKPFVSEAERLKFRKKSCLLSFIYGAVCIIFLILPIGVLKRYGYCILLGMLSASISMIIEHIIQKNKFREGGLNNEKY